MVPVRLRGECELPALAPRPLDPVVRLVGNRPGTLAYGDVREVELEVVQLFLDLTDARVELLDLVRPPRFIASIGQTHSLCSSSAPRSPATRQLRWFFSCSTLAIVRRRSPSSSRNRFEVDLRAAVLQREAIVVGCVRGEKSRASMAAHFSVGQTLTVCLSAHRQECLCYTSVQHGANARRRRLERTSPVTTKRVTLLRSEAEPRCGRHVDRVRARGGRGDRDHLDVVDVIGLRRSEPMRRSRSFNQIRRRTGADRAGRIGPDQHRFQTSCRR